MPYGELKLYNSDAEVRVYKGNELIDCFYVDKKCDGTVWHVFDITKNGIVKINDYYFEYDPERIE